MTEIASRLFPALIFGYFFIKKKVRKYFVLKIVINKPYNGGESLKTNP